MLVFIDESGDAGFKFDKGSSTHFTVTLVLFNDKEEALKTDNHISEIRKQLGLRSDFEFHFHKTAKRLCRHFFVEICEFDFQYFSVVIDKRRVDVSSFENPQSFYNFACELVCQRAKELLMQAIIVIDGKKSKEFKTKLGNYLKKNVNDRSSRIFHIKKVKMQDSTKNNLLQLADMICGAVARSFKDDKENFREIIIQREVLIDECGGKK